MNKRIFRLAINYIGLVIGAENILKIEAWLRFRKKINFKNPQTLSDKICYLEFRETNPLVVICSDKYEVRRYIESKGLKNLLVPLTGSVYSSAEEIDFDKLPGKFVIKATYGCQMNIICENKNNLDIKSTKKTIDKWLSNGFNRDILEPHYKKIPKRIICEKFLESTGEILDYKFHCINGEPTFILVCSERDKFLKLNIYDTDWKPIHEICGKHLNNKEIERPECLEEMIQISRKLSEDFKFVRVDLYQINRKVYFGELTFTPDGGMLSYFTHDFDMLMGSMLNLKENQ